MDTFNETQGLKRLETERIPTKYQSEQINKSVFGPVTQ